MVKNVTVFCASSTKADNSYMQAASDLGRLLASNSICCYYGGGRVGLMGALADAMVKARGSIYGVIPKFMVDEGWDNDQVEEIVVADMQLRKQKMLAVADAIVALPGGCGTLEELMEAITARQLGLITVPIIIVNINGYFSPLVEMLKMAEKEHFMRPEHMKLWSLVDSVDDVIPAIESAPIIKDAREIAAM